MDISGNTIFIPGATSGIGLALAIELHNKGNTVIAGGRRTEPLPGQQDSEVAMPLDEFVAETMNLLQTQPDAKEIQVERVKFLRYGEARGDYDQAVATLNHSDPHGN